MYIPPGLSRISAILLSCTISRTKSRTGSRYPPAPPWRMTRSTTRPLNRQYSWAKIASSTIRISSASSAQTSTIGLSPEIPWAHKPCWAKVFCASNSSYRRLLGLKNTRWPIACWLAVSSWGLRLRKRLSTRLRVVAMSKARCPAAGSEYLPESFSISPREPPWAVINVRAAL